jgi:hypothetical protein
MGATGQGKNSKVKFHTMFAQAFKNILMNVLLMGRNGMELYSDIFGKADKDEHLTKMLKQTFNDESVFEMLEDTLKEIGIYTSKMINQAFKKESILKLIEEISTKDVVNEKLWQAFNDSASKEHQDLLQKGEVYKMLTGLFNDKKMHKMVKQALQGYFTQNHTNVEEATNQNNVHEKISCIASRLIANTANCKFNINERHCVNIYNPFKIESFVWSCNTGSITFFRDRFVFFSPTEDKMRVVKRILYYISILKHHQVYLYTGINTEELEQGENCSLVVAFEHGNNHRKRTLILQLNVVTSDMFESAMNNAQMQSIV